MSETWQVAKLLAAVFSPEQAKSQCLSVLNLEAFPFDKCQMSSWRSNKLMVYNGRDNGDIPKTRIYNLNVKNFDNVAEHTL